MPLTDGTDNIPRNLPLGRFEPVGPWATGTAYLARDLVSQGRGSYVALADHTAGAFADDLAAGLWLAVAKGAAGGINPRGTYDPTVTYAKGDAVLVTPDGGVTYVQTAARTDLPAGTALDHVDADGNPSWVAVSCGSGRRSTSTRPTSGPATSAVPWRSPGGWQDRSPGWTRGRSGRCRSPFTRRPPLRGRPCGCSAPSTSRRALPLRHARDRAGSWRPAIRSP